MASAACLRSSLGAERLPLGRSVAARRSAVPQLPLARRRQRTTAAAAGSQGDWEFLQRSASNVRQKWEEIARQQRLNERVQQASQVASKFAQQAADEAQKRAKQVDSEYDVSGKAADAARTAADGARRVNDMADNLESRWRVRSRVKYFFADLKRTAPQRMARVREFFDTPLGAVTFLFVFMLSVFTGAFWVIVRWMFSFIWLFILLGPLIINYLNAKAVREQQARYREYAEEQQRRQQDPLYGTPFEGVFGGAKRGGGARRGAARKFDSADVIDVSIDHTDD